MKIPEEKRVAFNAAFEAMPNKMSPGDFVFFIFCLFQVYELSDEEVYVILTLAHNLITEHLRPHPSSIN